MKRRMIVVLMACMLCTACSALPAEERAFAVALGVSGSEGNWTLYARVPAYRTGGGYLTVTGRGDSLPHAMADLDAAAPMQLHPGQMRLVIVAADTAHSADFPFVTTWLADWRELRPEAYLAVTEEDMGALMDTLKPLSGTRLSKSLDVLLQTRLQQGWIPESTLADVLCMGERQSPVLGHASVGEGRLTLSGSWPVGTDNRVVGAPLTQEETQLLSLLQGRLKQGMLSLPEGAVRLTDASADVQLAQPAMQSAAVQLVLRMASGPMTAEMLSRTVATSCLELLNRLSADGCDALGLGRRAVVQLRDMDAWHELDWNARLRQLEWAVSVGAE